MACAPSTWPLLRGPTRRFWDRSAAAWDERIRPDAPEHLAPLIAACDRLEVAPRRILDLGTGTGSGALMLARRFRDAELHGVDISEEMVRVAQSKVPPELSARIRFAAADAAALPYEDEAFDLVAQLNLPVYFDEVARVLRPGAYVIVASSLGSATPYHTPARLLRRGFARRGVLTLETGRAGSGSYWLAQRSPPAVPLTGRSDNA